MELTILLNGIQMDFLSKVKKSDFFKSISLLASGSIISQIITLIASPIMTRMFSPAEIGGFTLILTAVSIFSPLLSLRYDLVIVSEQNEAKCYSLIKLCLILCIIISILVSLGYIFYFTISDTMPFNVVITFLTLFCLLVTTGLINILTSYNNRLKQYKLMSKVNIVRSFAQNIIMIFMGILKTGVIGLTISQISGLFFGIKEQSRYLLKNKSKLYETNAKGMKEVASKYKKQVIWSTPAALLNSFSYSSINIFIQSLFGANILGLYSLSFRALGVPLNVVSNNVSKVYYEKGSKEMAETGSFKKSLTKTFLFILPLSLCMFVFLLLFSPICVRFLFGDNWKTAGDFIRILSILFSVRLIATCIGTPSLILGNRQDYDLKFQILLVSVSIFDFIICLLFNYSIIIFLLIYTVLSTFVNLWSIIVCFKLSR